MKNYDVKLVSEVLKTKTITEKGKRPAFLVPTMFNKIISGFTKKTSSMMPSASVEPVQDVNMISNNVATPIKAVPTASVQSNLLAELQNEAKVAKEQAEKTANEVQTNTNPVNNNETKVSSPSKEKNYVTKTTKSDVDYLQVRKLPISSTPRRLLISTVFLQKLVSHRQKAISEFISSVKEELKEEAVDVKQAAVTKYVELLNKRKEAIEVKQACEKEITDIVNKYGITMDMVNAELAKGNIQR